MRFKMKEAILKMRRIWCFLFGPCGSIRLVEAPSGDLITKIWMGRIYCNGCGKEIVE